MLKNTVRMFLVTGGPIDVPTEMSPEEIDAALGHEPGSFDTPLWYDLTTVNEQGRTVPFRVRPQHLTVYMIIPIGPPLVRAAWAAELPVGAMTR